MSDFQPYQPSKTTAFENEQDDEFEEPRNFDGALSDGNDNDPDGTEGGAGQETYTIEFLSDYEENLPEYFDANKVKRENLSNCKLCGKKFSLLTKKHHCRKCGATVCDQCCQGKLKLSKRTKPERVCFKCEIELTNEFYSNLTDFVEIKKKEKEDLLNAIKNKRKDIEIKKSKIESMKEKKRQEDGKFKMYKEKKEGEIQDLKADLEKKKEHRRKLEEEIKEIDEQKKTKSLMIVEAKEKLKNLNEQLEKVKKEKNDKDEEFKKLQNEINQIEESRNEKAEE